ncbi:MULTISPECIES: hypothetical protein [Cupriavidus]|jgi:hypothetical protein|uniref:hypothetical protein n=1 Tax=Cupriavidus TaxID=106589 RepID=UPI000462F49F|nr:hypothetical protein [Cupriavidus metallidurans]AVA38325.1 hypothetical protein C3Z06_32490 [Cupriavidus metallidurans]KWW32327.1 hypothetical protein AU374_05927 [Cupriavidus metallidurans]
MQAIESITTAQMPIRRTTTQRVIYCGRTATCCEYLLQSGSTGLRVVSRHFDGGTTTEVRLIYGDGRTAKFREYLSANVAPELVDATVADFAAKAAEQHAIKKHGFH